MSSFSSSLVRLLFGFWNPPRYQPVSFLMESVHLTRAYCVAAELGIADLLDERPRSIEELAEATLTDRASLFRVLRTLAAFRVFAEDRQGRFRMTRRARVLLTGGSASLRSWLILMGRSEIWQGYAHTLEAVKTGVPAFELAHGKGFYEYLAGDEQLGTTFASALDGWTAWQCREIVKAFDFGRFHVVIDVGGGMGSLLRRILTAHPHVRGILFDQSATVDKARPRFEAAGLAARCDFVGGSFLKQVPPGADLCIVKHVLRDWNDEAAGAILRNCNRAIEPGGTLLVIGAVLDPRNGADRIVKLVDLELASLLGGGLRTRAQLQALLDANGFRLFKIHGTTVPDSQIMEAVKVSDPLVGTPVA